MWNEDIKKELGYCGEDVFIGHNVMILNPHLVHLGDRVRIDPFTLITCALKCKSNIQICSHVVLGGGASSTITMHDWTFIGYGSQFFCGSEDYSGDHGPVNNFWGKNKVYQKDIYMNPYSGVASQCIVFPGVRFPYGAVVGAQSMVRKSADLDPWAVHKGTPALPWKKRNVKNIREKANDPEFLRHP